MPRPYVVGFENVLVSAAQDLLQVKGATGKMLDILRVWLGATDTTLVTAQSIRIRCRYLPATVTDGSGGSTSTPRPLDPGDAAASFTCLTNNTTQATTSGTAAVLPTEGDHIYSGVNLPFRNPPQVGPSESFTFELLSTVSGTVHLSGGAEVTERGG
jgi:hypothetical protein